MATGVGAAPISIKICSHFVAQKLFNSMNDYIDGYRPTSVDSSAPMTTFSRPTTGPNLFIDDIQNEWIDISMPDGTVAVNILDIYANIGCISNQRIDMFSKKNVDKSDIRTNIWDIWHPLYLLWIDISIHSVCVIGETMQVTSDAD